MDTSPRPLCAQPSVIVHQSSIVTVFDAALSFSLNLKGFRSTISVPASAAKFSHFVHQKKLPGCLASKEDGEND